MSQEFKIKNGLIVSGDATISGAATVNGNSVIHTGNVGSYAVTSLTDTLASVTGRGATTTSAVTVGSLSSTGNINLNGGTLSFNTNYFTISNGGTLARNGGSIALVTDGSTGLYMAANAGSNSVALFYANSQKFITGPEGIVVSNSAGNGLIQLTSASSCVVDILNAQSEAYLRTTSYHDLHFRTNNVNRMMISKDGNVGIGTTSIYSTTKLKVKGADSGLILLVSGDTKGVRIGADTNGGFIGGVDQTGFGSDQPLTFRATKYQFDLGNVLINTSTDAGYKLDVNGTARVQGVLTGTANINGLTVSNNNSNPVIGSDGTNVLIGSNQLYRIVFSSNRIDFKVSDGTNPVNAGSFTSSGSLYVGGNASTTAKLQVSGSVTASTALAQGVYFNNTLVAAANNDVLVGLDINPTFTNGAFTGVTNWGIRAGGLVSAYGGLTTYNNTAANTYAPLINNTARSDSSPNYTFYGYTALGMGFTNTDIALGFFNSGLKMKLFSTGNLSIGTTTDTGYKLDVNGTGRFTGALTASSLIKSGGTSWQYLKGDGSVTTVNATSDFVRYGDYINQPTFANKTITLNPSVIKTLLWGGNNIRYTVTDVYTGSYPAAGSTWVKTYELIDGTNSVYSGGNIYLGFWVNRPPANITVRVQNTSGVWTGPYSGTEIRAGGSCVDCFAYWKIPCGGPNYIKKWEITLTPQDGYTINLQTVDIVIDNSEGIDQVPFVSRNGSSIYGTLSFIGSGPTTNAYITNGGVIGGLVLKVANNTGILEFQSSGGTKAGSMFMDGSIWRLKSSNSTDTLNIFANGNLGIKQTTDAGYTFDVNGTARFSGNTYLAGDILVSNGSGTRYIQASNGSIGFLSSNSSGYNLWTSNSNVGIKSELYINSDLNYNTGIRLRIGSTQTSPSGYSYELSFQPGANHLPTHTAIRTLDSTYGGNSTVPSPLYIFGGQNTTTGTYAHVILQSDFTTKRGNVGIGLTNPQGATHIAVASGTPALILSDVGAPDTIPTFQFRRGPLSAFSLQVDFPSNNKARFQIGDAVTGYEFTGGNLGLTGGKSIEFAGITGQTATAIVGSVHTDNNNGQLVFSTRGSAVTAERMRISSSGNVGIGTDQPVGQLNVFGGTGNNPAILTLQSQSGGGGNTGIYFRPYQNVTFANTAPAQATILAVDASYSAHITFSTKIPGSGSNALVERMRLSSTGSLMIGSTTDTGEALQVTGSIKSTALSTNGPVVSSGGVLNSVNGYTGMVTIQQPVPMPPITFDIQNGIIVNVM